ncbi:hypothetical protein [Desulfogranum japonicum]|uniref:hypothetical protein n=1 Tax=Desulfogranum japonicum TaxID=231447 RepID=UPI0003F5BC7C|nr:hypothetical protein [Desulfogranum japonicum]
MRTAQIVSSLIYLLFVGLATVLFHSDFGTDVTAITHMAAPVAVILPILLSFAAIGSQFSAAVADTSGAGGLIEELVHQKLPPRYTYLLILCITITISWETNVNSIISYASRAFALYYTLQCLVAVIITWQNTDIPRRGILRITYTIIAGVCFAVFLLGLPSE